MLVNHGAGGYGEGFMKRFVPYASPNSIVMLWPTTAKAWDDSGYTGSMYNTKNSIQSLFIQEVISKISEDLDPTYDYKVEGGGKDIVTVAEGEEFIAGMINQMLELHELS